MILRAKLNYQTLESSEGIHAHIYFGKKLNNYYVFFFFLNFLSCPFFFFCLFFLFVVNFVIHPIEQKLKRLSLNSVVIAKVMKLTEYLS